MCWGVPARVLSVVGQTATVDLGGVRRDVLVGMREISPGELVMIHAGVAIGRITSEDVIANLEVYRDIRAYELVDSGLDEEKAIETATDEINKLLHDLGINESVKKFSIENIK